MTAMPSAPETRKRALPWWRLAFRERDLLMLAYLPAMAMLSRVTPERAWMRACMLMERPSGRVVGRQSENARRIAAVLSGRVPADAPARLAVELGAHHHYTRLQLFRCRRSPGWRPPMTLIGREHVEAALAARTGAVLWLAPFVYANIGTKMALHQGGFAVAHLRGWRHGLSASNFGVRFLNPIWTGVEDRFLAATIPLTADLLSAMRELMHRLSANQLVSITMGSNGRRTYSVPFFDGRLTLANGAPRLAQHTGAALLPVFTVRGADGVLVTTIEAPARIPAAVTAEEAVRQHIVHGARLLESYVSRWPGQFNAWEIAQPRSP
jgi:lauroyl/myristoyl acyltransferase